MEKSIEQIVAEVEKKIVMLLLTELPVPTCALKKAKREWKIEQIKQQLSNKLTNDQKGAE